MMKTLHIDWQIIMINGILMDNDKFNLEQKQTVVAHELAHAYLKHDQDGDNENMEQEADDLIQGWGFKPSSDNIPNKKKMLTEPRGRRRHDWER